MKDKTRTGLGFDIHRTDPDRPPVLGGVHIADTPFGLAGHSDADVVLHAVTDACLGALALGDIGRHFPDTDPQWKDADSRKLLSDVVRLVQDKGWRIGNVDVTVMAEAPKLAPCIPEMRKCLAEVLGCVFEAASVKATTHEGLGPIGNREGIAAFAVVTLQPAEDQHE